MIQSKPLDRASPPSPLGSDAAKTVFAAGGLLAAFGAASCCALPVALSLLGISAASLTGIGFAAAAYQHELFYFAAFCILGGGVILWRERQRVGCARPALDRAAKIAFVLAIGFLVLTFWIEPPI